MKSKPCKKTTRFPVLLFAIILSIIFIPASAGLKDVESFDVTDSRNLCFCEVIRVMPGGAEACNSTGMNDCSPVLWKVLDTHQLKSECNAQFVVLNGPRFWMMDEQTLWFGGTDSFGGVDMKWAATLPPAGPDREGIDGNAGVTGKVHETTAQGLVISCPCIG